MNLFPYTNGHELNLDWILKVVKDFQSQYQNIDTNLQHALDEITAAANAALHSIEGAEETAISDLRIKLDQGIATIDQMLSDGQITLTHIVTDGEETLSNAAQTCTDAINAAAAIAQQNAQQYILNINEAGRTNTAAIQNEGQTALAALSAGLAEVNEAISTGTRRMENLYNWMPQDVQDMLSRLRLLDNAVFNWEGYTYFSQGRYIINSQYMPEQNQNQYEVSSAYIDNVDLKTIEIYTDENIIIKALQVFTGTAGTSSFTVTDVTPTENNHLRYTFPASASANSYVGFSIVLGKANNAAIVPTEIKTNNLKVFWDNNIVSPNRIAYINLTPNTAVYNYNNNDFMFVAGRLFKATQNIGFGQPLITTGNTKNIVAISMGEQVTTNMRYIDILTAYAAKGFFAITANDLEQGSYNASVKLSYTYRARLKYFVPVKSGMRIVYTSPTYDIFIGVIANEYSTTYAQNESWITSPAGTVNITADGYLVFVIRNRNNPTQDVNPAAFDGTVTIETVIKQQLDGLTP